MSKVRLRGVRSFAPHFRAAFFTVKEHEFSAAVLHHFPLPSTQPGARALRGLPTGNGGICTDCKDRSGPARPHQHGTLTDSQRRGSWGVLSSPDYALPAFPSPVSGDSGHCPQLSAWGRTGWAVPLSPLRGLGFEGPCELEAPLPAIVCKHLVLGRPGAVKTCSAECEEGHG